MGFIKISASARVLLGFRQTFEAREVMEEKQTKKIGKRRTQAQRLMADTTTRHLEQLTKKARALAGEAEPEDVSLKAISKRLSSLQQMHSRLQESLASGSEQLIAARLRQEFEDAQAESTSVEELEEEDCNDGIIAYIRREFLLHREGEMSGQEDSMRKLFCLEGKIICGLKEGRIGVQYDTFYAGEPVESYYLVLASRSYSENLFVCEHTVPFFLPLQETERRHLSSSAAMFINIIGDLLQAYVSRREQIKAFKESKADKIKHVSHSVRCDVVDFMVEEFECKVTVSLGYEDLRSELPTRAKAVIWPPVSSKGKCQPIDLEESKPRASPISLVYAEKILKQEFLSQAYKELVDGMNTIFSGQTSSTVDAVPAPPPAPGEQ